MENLRPRPLLAWASVILLVLLCAGLAILQYRWIGELTEAERGRLHDALHSRLNALSRSFNEEISKSAYALVPSGANFESATPEAVYSTQYRRWKESHERVFRRIAIAVPEGNGIRLLNLDLDTAQFSPVEWPSEWSAMHERLMQRLQGPGGMGRIVTQGPPVFELPRFGMREPGQHGPQEQEWLVVELNLDYVRGTLLPQLLHQYLEDGGRLDYDAEVVEKTDPGVLIYSSVPGKTQANPDQADATVSLLEIEPNGFGGRGRRDGPGGPGPGGPPRSRRGLPAALGDGREHGPERAGPPPPLPDRGRWQLLVRHSAGSIEALVARTRRGNLAVSGAILLLILATIASLVRFSRRAQQLAELQINFVAGVSHELRTPVTVIRTAAFNLQGRMASRPEQVQRYGALIQAESEKLTALVEQVLRFASTMAGHVIRSREPVAIDAAILDGLRFIRADADGASLMVYRQIDPALPLVLADELALRHAMQNLVDNALKYGTEGSNWIGVFASPVPGEHGQLVEIRIADHGPGIPSEEQEHIFDPFFRGRRAVQDQVHGSGLGLYLVKRIVEAHGGTIQVRSAPITGTEFIVRIPAAPPEMQDEFAHSLD